ncbi:lipid binding protein [Russula earlei]|uniref:Lipid binding protein n=1 Tax=Russula earlei TaxID=71964 RepID=A0ACC0ULX2_9AGAM|nr:lipid binding protein [Russula earlei]
MLGDDTEDVFDSVTWESPADNGYPAANASLPSRPGFKQSIEEGGEDRGPHDPKWYGYLITQVKDPVKELAETKDAYVSYLVTAKTNLSIFSTPNPSSRRRFQDFVFLRNNLAKDFPACVVPPLPDKHRLEYITGDRFSPEFMERRRQDLHRFLQRIARHPILQRSTLVRAFFESTEWHVIMHQHVAHPPGPEQSQGVIDNLSDTLLNAFARVRKPDERFLVMRENVDKFEESLSTSERLWNRVRTRTTDLRLNERDLPIHLVKISPRTIHDLAVAVQGLGFLESGITDQLNHFSNTLLEFSALLRHTTQNTMDPFLKQLDLEELTEYLSGVTAERDRLSAIISGHAGSSGLGLSAYLRDKMDAIRGADDDRSRVEKMKKLDVKIKELNEAVTTAHETSDTFSNETLREQATFQYAKEAEMKEMLSNFADGQIELYKSAMEEWDRIIPIIQRIRVDV